MNILNKVILISILALFVLNTSCLHKEDGFSPQEETLLDTHTLPLDDSNNAYVVNVYYSDYYERARIEVFRNGQVLKGLFNRRYGVDPIVDSSAKLTTYANGSILVEIGQGRSKEQHGHLIVFVPLAESGIDSDVIYDTVEKYIDGAYYWTLLWPTGLLEDTCFARVFRHKDRVNDYIVTDDGNISPLESINSVCMAYFAEGIKAPDTETAKDIAKSIIEVYTEHECRGKASVICSPNDIPGYSNNPFKTKQNEDVIEAPWLEVDPDETTYRWSFFTYNGYHGVVRLFTITFNNGNLVSAQERIVENLVGEAHILGCEELPKKLPAENKN